MNKIEFYIRLDKQSYFYDFDLVSDYNVHQICDIYNVDSIIFESKAFEGKNAKEILMVRIIPTEDDVTILDTVKTYIKKNCFFTDKIAEKHYSSFLEKYDKDDAKKLINSDK